MKNFGYILIVVGFLGAALTTVLDTIEVRWVSFFVGIAVGIAGVAMVRIITSRAAREEGALAGNITNINESLASIVEKITRLNQEKESINPYDLRHKIDELFPEDIATFVDAREAIGHVYSLQAYADVMSIFSAGERYLNRVWSASADGYINECHTYLEKAREQFTSTLDTLQKLTAESA
ncbi:hypothetical protein ACFL45_04505 [Candidatus Neomarinimicrobiota bacterium]